MTNDAGNLLLGPPTISAEDLLNGTGDGSYFIHNSSILKNHRIDALVNAILDDTAYYMEEDDWQILSNSDDIKFLKKGERAFFQDLPIYDYLDVSYQINLGFEALEEVKKIISEYEIDPEEFNINIYDHYAYWNDIISSYGYNYNKKTDDLLIAEYFWADHNISEALVNLSTWDKESAITLLSNSQQYVYLTPDQMAILEVMIAKNAKMMILGADIDFDIKNNYINSGFDLIKALHVVLKQEHTKSKSFKKIIDILLSHSDIINTHSLTYHLARMKSLLLILSELRKNPPKNDSFYKVRVNLSETSYYYNILKKAGLKKIRHNFGHYSINTRNVLMYLSTMAFSHQTMGLDFSSRVPQSSLVKNNVLEIDLLISRVILMDYLSYYVKSYFDSKSDTGSDELIKDPILKINDGIVNSNIQKYVYAFNKSELLKIVRNLKL